MCTQFTNVNGNEFYGVEFSDRHFQTKSKPINDILEYTKVLPH